METNGRYIGNRSLQAFHWSVEKLVEHAHNNNEKLYFWTFTFVKKMAPWRYYYHWQPFARDLWNELRSESHIVYGVRVTEPHKKGGLHYHAIVNHRISVHDVRRIGKRYGVGRVHVKPVWNVKGAADYLAKYMAKDWDGRKLPPGIRRWSTMWGFEGARVNAIIKDTPQTRAVRLYKSVVLRGAPVPFSAITVICSSMNISDPEHLAACLAHAKENGGDTVSFTWSWSRVERELMGVYS